jgi:hypothetical protein
VQLELTYQRVRTCSDQRVSDAPAAAAAHPRASVAAAPEGCEANPIPVGLHSPTAPTAPTTAPPPVTVRAAAWPQSAPFPRPHQVRAIRVDASLMGCHCVGCIPVCLTASLTVTGGGRAPLSLRQRRFRASISCARTDSATSLPLCLPPAVRDSKQGVAAHSNRSQRFPPPCAPRPSVQVSRHRPIALCSCR